MIRRLILAMAITTAADASLAQQAPRDSDTLLDQTELTTLLSGQVMEFYDNSLATYLADGRYEYRYAPGQPPFLGTYEVADGSSVCITFDNGFERCDLIVDDGSKYVMIIANGDRYPVRALAAIE